MKDSAAWCLFVCLFVCLLVGKELVTLPVRIDATIKTFISRSFVY
jgi:hypothetical protein